MSNRIQSFRAATAEEAMAQVYRELGLDAVVVEMTQIASRGLLSWLTARQEFEVKASPAIRKEARRPSFIPTTENTIAATAAARKSLTANANEATFSNRADADSMRSIVKAQVQQLSAESIEQRLASLQQMIVDLSRRPSPRGLVDIPPELFPHYMTLVEAGVEDELAHDLIQALLRHATAGQLSDTKAMTALLTALIEQRIPCSDMLAPIGGQRKIAVLVGPTGVGKTTTLAKLAACFGVEQGRRVGLITVDNYRVAAAEQLRTYAEIIDLPMQIVRDPAQMQEALDTFATYDLVLVDTAGRSPQDERGLAEFKQLIDSACPDHVYLVLSLASGTAALKNAAERFSAIRPTSLVLTKLDEAAGCGGLLSATHETGLPISYITTGQEVPVDLEPANPCRAARLIVGTDRRTDSQSVLPSL